MSRRTSRGGHTPGRSRKGKGTGSGELTAVRRIPIVVGIVMLVVLGVQLGTEGREPAEAVFEPRVWEEGRVRVEVLNAGGVSGKARDATFALREAGFDVVDFGNAPGWDPADPVLESTVYDRVGRLDAARAVAARLGIDNVLSDPDPNLYVDVTVVVGRSWAGPNAGSRAGESGPSRPWWDPRGWFGR